MALNGSFQNLCMSKDRCGLYCTWSATQSVIGNYSDVTVNTYLRIFDIDIGGRTLTSNINGNTENIAISAIDDDGSKLHDVLINTRTVRVNHNSSGGATGVVLSVSYDIRASYSDVYYSKIEASTTIDLNTIDRVAPTVSVSLSSVTSSSVIVTASSNATIDVWECSVNNGASWTQISTTVGTLVTYTITGLSPNTEYNVKIRARRQYNQVLGVSATSKFKTLGNTLLNSVNTLTVDDVSPILSMNWTVYSNYTHKLIIKDGSTTVLTITDLTCSTGTNNKTIALTSEQRTIILQYMTSMKSFTATFELLTYNGDTQIGGVSSKTATIQTTYENSAPIFMDFTHRDYNRNGTADITGNNQIYIKDRSSMYIEVGERYPQNGTTFDKFRVTIGSYVKESTTGSFEFGSIAAVGDNVALTVEVIDCRGYSTAITKNITVVDYEPVSITDYSIRRKNEVESIAQLSFSGVFSPIMVDGEAKNKIVSAEYRVTQNGTTIVGWISKTVTQTSDSFEYSTMELSHPVGFVNFDPELQYIVEVRVTDRLKSDTVALTLNKGTPLVAFRPKKVGINEPNPTAALHIRGDGELLKLNDETLAQYIMSVVNGGVSGQNTDGNIFDKIYPVGSVYISTNNVNPNVLFGGEWEQIEDRFLLACSSEYEAGSIGGEATHKLTAAEMPKHAHNDGTDSSKAINAPLGGEASAIVYFEASYGTRGTTEAGGDQPHNNMPPYIAVYMWKRIN